MKRMRSGEFHGARRETRRVAGLTLAETEYEPGHRLPLHAHDNPFFSLLLRGSFTEKLERGGRTCVPTSLVYYPENEPHSEAFAGQGGRAFNVELAPGWVERLDEEGLRRPDRSFETRASRLNWIATRLYASFAEGDGASVELEELALALMSAMSAQGRRVDERRPPPWLARVREVLHARASERVSVTELADEAGVHPVHLARVFRRHHGCTIGEYVRRLRTERACAALAHTETPLSVLALDAGYADQAHFTRHFKRVTGITPGAYRTLLAG